MVTRYVPSIRWDSVLMACKTVRMKRGGRGLSSLSCCKILAKMSCRTTVLFLKHESIANSSEVKYNESLIWRTTGVKERKIRLKVRQKLGIGVGTLHGLLDGDCGGVEEVESDDELRGRERRGADSEDAVHGDGHGRLGE